MINYLKFKDLNKRARTEHKNIDRFVENVSSFKKESSFRLRFKTMLFRQILFQKASLTQSKNRCLLNNSSRGINRLTSLSKGEFKRLYAKKRITGFTKASW